MPKKVLDQVCASPERVTKVIEILPREDHELYVEIGHDSNGKRILILTNNLTDGFFVMKKED